MNWLTIGQFSDKTGLTSKALRLYEEMNLLSSNSRGENGYRYYHIDQIEKAIRLKEFKNLGFSLAEIKSLLNFDEKIGSEKLIQAMKSRLKLVSEQVSQLDQQKNQIESILSSLEYPIQPLMAQQRRAIMSFYGKVFIVITGCDGLQKTAQFVQQHFKNAKQEVPILNWAENTTLPAEKPYILIVKESDLRSDKISNLNPDVVVIKNLGSPSIENQNAYLNLYTEVGPHVNTIISADDRASIELASQAQVKKGRIFYFSKNRALEKQIKHIGGVISDGEELEIFGFNLKPEVINLKLGQVMAFEDEIALISSLGAVMTVGFGVSQLHT